MVNLKIRLMMVNVHFWVRRYQLLVQKLHLNLFVHLYIRFIEEKRSLFSRLCYPFLDYDICWFRLQNICLSFSEAMRAYSLHKFGRSDDGGRTTWTVNKFSSLHKT